HWNDVDPRAFIHRPRTAAARPRDDPSLCARGSTSSKQRDRARHCAHKAQAPHETLHVEVHTGDVSDGRTCTHDKENARGTSNRTSDGRMCSNIESANRDTRS